MLFSLIISCSLAAAAMTSCSTPATWGNCQCPEDMAQGIYQLVTRFTGPAIIEKLKAVAESEKKSGKTCTDARAAILKAGCKMVKPEMIANIFKLCKAKISVDEWRCAKTSTPNLILWDKYD
ncbi:hypothetical protein ANCCAN_17180 [Ancylostoma caninum]|uniref:Surfactant protein B n=1 Tax=Ancylostoma caninum TaxID=29170 RepID=A0A368G117_ANCCA|nr:hypothetical protein ANCCAN_17180 [Ancylostoma caninum]